MFLRRVSHASKRTWPSVCKINYWKFYCLPKIFKTIFTSFIHVTSYTFYLLHKIFIYCLEHNSCILCISFSCIIKHEISYLFEAINVCWRFLEKRPDDCSYEARTRCLKILYYKSVYDHIPNNIYRKACTLLQSWLTHMLVTLQIKYLLYILCKCDTYILDLWWETWLCFTSKF